MIDYAKFLGRKYGSYTVVSEAKKTTAGSRAWECRCECGHTKVVSSGNLKRATYLKCTKACTVQRKSYAKFYMTWVGILGRCNDKNNVEYCWYGGRGISVCDEWQNDYWAFHEWATANYKDGCTIDRINNNGNYCPDNCRYATRKEQANNRRNNKLFTHKNETKTLAQWQNHFGISKNAFQGRIKRGWTILNALKKPQKIYVNRKH